MDNNIIGKLENILFAAGDAMEISQIAQYFELDIEELTSAIDEEILKRENRPDAIIAGSDEVAAGILTEAMNQGIKVPEDLAIVGVDDQPIASLLPIPLTTIRQPVQDEGMLAAKEIIRQLSEEPDDTVRKELELELVIRQSA